MDTLIKDVRYGVRTLRNARGFTLVAILTLALGIGATTAMFSVVNAVLLRPLPFRDPDRLVSVGEFNKQRPVPRVPRGSLSYPDFLDARNRTHTLEDVAMYSTNGFTLTGTGIGEAVHIEADNVTANLFRLLGVQPALGRDFLPNDDEPGHHVAILSNELWRGQFHADPKVLGRSVNLNGQEVTIVGVMPPGFQFPIRETPRAMWLTFSRLAESGDATPALTKQRGSHFGMTIARLKPGVTLAQANSDLAAVANSLSTEFPNSNLDVGLGAAPEIEHMVGRSRSPLLLLFGAVGLVLMIACANVANLLLARSSARGREIAIRAALGASRTRIVRQLVTESVVLSISGAVAGVGVAVWALAAVVRLYPANLPRAEQISIDASALTFTIVLAVATGILFGLAPAIKVSAPNLTEAMREGRATTAGAGHIRWRSALVVTEVALGVMLLIGAGLLIRSLERLAHVHLGLNPTNVLTANFNLSQSRYDPDQKDRFITELMQRIRALPGVVSAAGAMPMPLNNDDWSISFNYPDRPVPKSKEPQAIFYNVQPGFFETMQIPLLRGRTFDRRDQRNSDPVVVVSESFARQYFPDEDPIGKHIEVGAGEGSKRARYKNREIIGIVGDVRTHNLSESPQPAYYMPLPQLMWGPPTLVVRTAGDPKAITSALRKTLASMDPDAPLYESKTMEELLAMDLGRARFQASLLGIFAAAALLLTAVGLYGVMAYTVAQRTHEIGVRMALGASRSDVLRMVVHRGVVLTLSGIAVGVAGALALAKVIESLLYQIPPRDPATYAVVVFTLAIVALLASYIPAMRATRVDPMVALRYE